MPQYDNAAVVRVLEGIGQAHQAIHQTSAEVTAQEFASRPPGPPPAAPADQGQLEAPATPDGQPQPADGPPGD